MDACSGQVKKRMAVHDVGMGLAFAAPNPCSRDTAAKEDLTQALPNFREAGPVGVIKGDRA